MVDIQPGSTSASEPQSVENAIPRKEDGTIEFFEFFNGPNKDWQDELEKITDLTRTEELKPGEILDALNQLTYNYEMADSVSHFVGGVDYFLSHAQDKLIKTAEGPERDAVLRYVEAQRTVYTQSKLELLKAKKGLIPSK